MFSLHTLFVYWEHKSLQFMGFITDCPNVFSSLCELFIVNVTCLSPWFIIAWDFHFIQVDVQVLDIHKRIIYDNTKIVQLLLVTYDLVGFFQTFVLLVFENYAFSCTFSIGSLFTVWDINGVTFFFFSCLDFYFIFLFGLQNQQKQNKQTNDNKSPNEICEYQKQWNKNRACNVCFHLAHTKA